MIPQVTIFCEEESEIEEEKRRMEKLLNDLRIRAALRVCVLGNGEIGSYECLVRGKEVDVMTWSALEHALGGDTVRPLPCASFFSTQDDDLTETLVFYVYGENEIVVGDVEVHACARRSSRWYVESKE